MVKAGHVVTVSICGGDGMPSAAPWGFIDPALYSLDTAFHCVLLSFYCQCEYDLLEKLSIVSQLFIYFIIFTYFS